MKANFPDTKSLFYSVFFSVTCVTTLMIFWELMVRCILFVGKNPSNTYPSPGILNVLFLIAAIILFSGLTETFSLRKTLPVGVGFILFWGVASYISLSYYSFNLFFFRTSLCVIVSILLVHLRKIWKIDIALTDDLVSLASAGNLLEGKPDDLRIEGSLKLLETILPLSEAVVFRLDKTGNLTPIGRARTDSTGTTPSARHDSWRDIIKVCELASASGQTEIVRAENRKDTVQVALPLVCEGETIGVLYVKIKQDFESADRNLLEAFSEQLARNFQRKELRSKDLPNKFWWSFLSPQSSRNRLNVIKLINSNIKEQSFSVLASSYLKEAHAIAYLDGTLAYLNRQMRHLAKVDSENIFTLDLFSLLERFKTEVFSEPRLALRRVLQTGDPYANELFFPETGKTLKIQISLVKVPSNEQSIHDTNVPMKPACIMVTLRNVTAVKENARLRSDMASLMSHELRTPITSIQGFAELLLMDETINAENREFLTIIADESKRLSKMLATFLSVSKLEQSDKQEFLKTPVKLDSVVSEVIGDMQDQAKRKRIRLVESANTYLPPIAADKGLVSRAVSNLIENAIKYSPERTSVMISTILETDFLRVVVEDRGYGIPKNEQEKIWQKFYRVAREGQDKEEESTGLGLSLVKEIAEQHGGEVEVESEVGFGSKFSFKLPRL